MKQRPSLKRVFWPRSFFLPALPAMLAAAAMAAASQPSIKPLSARLEGWKSARLEGRKSAPPEGRKSAPPEGRKSALPEGRKSAPLEGRKSARLEGRKSAPPEGRKSAPPEGRKSAPPEGRKSAPPEGRKSAEAPAEASAAAGKSAAAAEAGKQKTGKKPKKTSAAPKRQISAAPQNIDAEFQERLESLSAICGAGSKSAAERLALFQDVLDQWAQWIYGKKAAGRLKLRDRSLLNEMLSQIQELPYRKIISEESSPKRAAELIRASFEHNFRYYHNLPEGSLISPAWARVILKALSCIDFSQAESPA